MPFCPANAATISVGPGGDFQSALNAAQPGDVIVLAAGATFTGNFELSVKSGADFITVQSSRCSELPTGVRVSPQSAALMARLATPIVSPALTAPVWTHHFRFQCIEFTQGSSVGDWGYTLIQLGESGTHENQGTLASAPHDLEFDRVIVRARDGQTAVQRGISLNSASTSITNSHISGIKWAGIETQAIACWNGPGPYRIENNYIEGAGINILFGGAPPTIPGLIPTDIQIRRNHFSKPTGWRGVWSVKNLLEFKNARRVVVDGNLFENNWLDGQQGYAIVFTPRPNDSGSAAVVEDINFTNNIVRHVAAGLLIAGQDSLYTAGPSERRGRSIRIANNLFEGIDGPAWGGDGCFMKVGAGADNITIEHNTVLQTGNIAKSWGDSGVGFVFRNNIARHNEYGFFGDNVGYGNPALNTYFPGADFRGNAIVKEVNPPWNTELVYPPGNFFPLSLTSVGFVNLLGGNYNVTTTSPYKNAATDGTDVGADIVALTAAQSSLGSGPVPNPFSTIRRAKRTAQDLTNSLASSSQPSTVSQLVATLVSEVSQAVTEFAVVRGSHSRAAEIDSQLTQALSSVLNSSAAAISGDIQRLKSELRRAIDHLSLGAVLIENPAINNPIDAPSFMVRQNYLDFLNREPDAGGEEFWTNDITLCGNDAQCLQAKRVNVSAAFFFSIESQQTGYYVYRLYKSSFGRLPIMTEFMPDTVMIARGVIVGSAGWQDRLTANKQEFVAAWIQRPAFQARYGGMNNDQFVSSLIENLGVTIDLNERNVLVQSLNNGASRATVVEQLATNPAFTRAEFNSAFVLMEYFGYLRRDPEAAGFNFWLNKLNQFNGNYSDAEMVRAFLESIEYRQRFRF